MTGTKPVGARARWRLSGVAIGTVMAVGIVATSSSARADEACRPEGPRVSPAVLTEVSKDPLLADDFLRFGFVAPGTVPDRIARPSAIRTFMTYSAFFEPSVPVAEAVHYVGLEPVEAETFLAIRCKHPNLDLLEPVLAKWPEIFNAVLLDFGAQATCPPTTSTAANELVCAIEAFVDRPTTTASEALANLYDIAAMISSDPALRTLLSQQYGIAVGFSGLGLAVKNSGNASFVYTAENVLDNAIVPEYLVRNVSIAAAGCHCLLVPPYPGRDEARLDPDYVWNVGTPECRTVKHLPSGPSCSIADVAGETGPETASRQQNTHRHR